MKNKTLFVLLLIPFVIAILGFVNITILKNTLEVDITGISWNYQENEGYKISNDGYLLSAEPIIDKNFTLAPGNDLVWTVENKDDSDNDYAKIEKQNDEYYLFALNEGEVIVTCQNEKKTVTKSFNAVIYEDGAVIINPKNIASSSSSITKKRYFGQYDLQDHDINKKTLASFEIEVKILPEDNDQSYLIKNISPNISLVDNVIYFNGYGEAYLELSAGNNAFITSTYTFSIVENGINVYDYNDLLSCTNKSENGEIVCLQTNLESLQNTYKQDENGNYINEYLNSDTKLFGNYDFTSKSFNFVNEVYQFETTYNHEYIKQYFKDDYLEHSYLYAAIHVQKDFYGNGFNISIHELAYPKNGEIDQYTGKLTPSKDKGDLFTGPLTFVSLGLFDYPFVKAYGQDNVNMYVDGDNIIINDLKIQNTNNLDNLYNLEFTGTVIDVKGDNVTIKNSIIKNGRTGVRVFSSDNFLLDNCLLMQTREFLFKIGNNEYTQVDENKNITINYNNQNYNLTSGEFLNGNQGFNADSYYTSLFDSNNISQQTLSQTQSALDNVSDEKTNATIKDTYFYQSGLFSIAFDTYFNGIYLYNGLPSFVKELLDLLLKDPVLPNNISGTQKGVNLSLEGDVRFYDYKDIASLDASCLIEERLGQLLGEFGDGEKITIDNYFPIKNLLLKLAKNQNLVYNKDNKNYLCTAVSFYGGGYNNSSLDISKLNDESLSEEITADIAYACLSGQDLTPSKNQFAEALAKCVPMAMGMNAFRFYLNDQQHKLFNQIPDQNDLISRGGNK